MIKLDRSKETIVVLCTGCPSLRELTTNLADAWSIGATHESRVHGAAGDATRAGVAYARRRA